MIVKCLECKGSVSDRAKTCPHCGCQLKEGFWGCVGSFLARLAAKRAKVRRRKEWIKFSLASYPYPVPYSGISHVEVHSKLEKVNGFGALQAALKDFPDIMVGVKNNLVWMKEKAKHDRHFYINLLFAAYCVGDDETLNSIISKNSYLSYDLAAEFMSKFGVPKVSDRYVMGFVDRFITFNSQKALEVYSKGLDWASIVTLHEDRKISWFKDRGVKIAKWVGGGKKQGRHFSHMGGAYTTLFFHSSAISEAVEQDDKREVAYLLANGADPNVTLSEVVDFSGRIPKRIGSNNDDADILSYVKSSEVFDLLIKAGVRCSDLTKAKWATSGAKTELKGGLASLCDMYGWDSV